MTVTDFPRSRFPAEQAPPAGSARALRPDHPAVVEGRTLFPTTVVSPREAPRLFVSGANQRKLGDRVTKGPWAGMPIYCLTLEERKTCPSTCHHWTSCYGNGMHWSRRLRHGPELEAGLERELIAFQRQRPRGFVVRLHILGDFYSVGYVERWAEWVAKFPALHVFGFTAWRPGTPIGDAVAALSSAEWARFAIRLSHTETGRGRAVTLQSADDQTPDGVICPAQTGKTAACGSCGLCWAEGARDKTIFFLTHGMMKASGPRKPKDIASRRPNAPNSAPGLVAALRAELAALLITLRIDPAFQKYEAIRKLLRFYGTAGAPPPGKPALVTVSAPVDRVAVLRRLSEGATNQEIAAEFRLTPQQAQGFRIGNRRSLGEKHIARPILDATAR